MPSAAPPAPARIEQHLALQVASLRDLVAHLPAAGLRPCQASPDGAERKLREPTDPLDSGIGTVSVADPENSVIEVPERNEGLFATVTG